MPRVNEVGPEDELGWRAMPNSSDPSDPASSDMATGDTASSSGTPRTLTQMFREWDDAALVALLLERPELAFPAPTDFSQIASRATTRHSIAQALELLNAFELWVAHCDTVAHCTTMSATGSSSPAGPPPTERADVWAARQRLLGLGLFWGDSASMRPVRALLTHLGESPPVDVPDPRPPSFDGAARQSPDLVAKVAAGSAFELVRRMGVFVEHCDHQPLKQRRSGGVGARETRAIAARIDVPSAVATAYLEIAQAAGLLGLSTDGTDELLVPTEAFDEWQQLELAQQWALLTHAWFEDHPPSGPGTFKRLCLEAFGSPAGGYVLSAEDMRTWLAWQRPRRPKGFDRAAATMLEQASWIGVTGLGAVAPFAPAIDADLLGSWLPARVDHVLVQADLTAIAPGPLTSDAAHDLGALADVESRGGATVYRFSQESLQRAHRLGWSVSEIAKAVEHRSRTPIPQALGYLIHDLDRLATTPTGQISEPAQTVSHLSPQRGRPVAATPGTETADQLDPQEAASIVATLRAAGVGPGSAQGTASGAEMEGGRVPDTMLGSPLPTLREAVETGETVWFGYVDTTGASGERLVRVTAVDEGRLRARDSRSGEPISVPLHRITAAHIVRAGTRAGA